MWETGPLTTQIVPIPPFDPVTLITGNGAFYRADKGVTLSGSNVTLWADQSSFAHNLGGGPPTPPTWSSTAFNGSFPGVIQADGVNGNNIIATTSFNNQTTTVSIFILLKVANNPNGNQFLLNFSDGSSQTNPTSILIFYGTVFGNGFAMYSGGNLYGNGGNSTTSTAGTYLFGGVFDGANGNIWLNGSVVGSGTANTTTFGSVSNGGWELCEEGITGRFTPAFTTAFWGVTQKVMNATDWTNLKNYCNSNWGTSF